VLALRAGTSNYYPRRMNPDLLILRPWICYQATRPCRKSTSGLDAEGPSRSSNSIKSSQGSELRCWRQKSTTEIDLERGLVFRRQSGRWYCQRRNKNGESEKMNRRSSCSQLTIALTPIASSHTANLDFMSAR